jgi:hypothetical protein
MAAFHESIRTAIGELEGRHPGEHILVFGSTENMMAAEEIMLGLAPDSRARTKVAVDHTGIMTWDLVPAPWSPAGRRTVLLRHNDSGHLPAAQRHSRFRAIPVLGREQDRVPERYGYDSAGRRPRRCWPRAAAAMVSRRLFQSVAMMWLIGVTAQSLLSRLPCRNMYVVDVGEWSGCGCGQFVPVVVRSARGARFE